MFSPRRRSSSCNSWAERNSTISSRSAEMALRWRVLRTPIGAASVLRGAIRYPFLCVFERVEHNPGEMIVDEFVEHLAAGPFAAHHTGRFEHPQMLADQWLRDPEGTD